MVRSLGRRHALALIAASSALSGFTGTARAFHRRYALNGAYLVFNPYARTQRDWAKPDVDRLIVLGDSYSATGGGAAVIKRWSTQLVLEGSARRLVDLAVIGATAANAPVNGQLRTFGQQLDRWTALGPAYGSRDLTVVYFGQNDINQLSGVATSLTALAAGIDRLIALGATDEERRLLLVLVHDLRRNPNRPAGSGERYLAWVPAVAKIAAARPNVVMVDLTTSFDIMFADPGRFGLTNVTTPDATNAATTALYADVGHFGYRGQQLISQVVRYYLTRGWDDAHLLLPGGTQVRRRIVEDASAGNVFRFL